LIEKSIKIIGDNLLTKKSPIDNQKSRWKFVFDRQFRSTIDPKKLNTATLIIFFISNAKYYILQSLKVLKNILASFVEIRQTSHITLINNIKYLFVS
jgi:hypothetical protein